jgi:6-phosphofructokinase 1
MGVAAVEGLLNGKSSIMIGFSENKIVYNSYDQVINQQHPIEAESMRIAKILSI